MNFSLRNCQRTRHAPDHFRMERPFIVPRKDNDSRWYVGVDSHECEYAGKDFDISMSAVLQKALPDFPLIAIDSDVLGGTPRIAGTRIPVSMVLDAVQYYGSIEGAKTSYPQLEVDQVKQALSFASVVLEQSVEHEFEASSR